MDPSQGVAPGEEARLQNSRRQTLTGRRFQQTGSHSTRLAFQDSDLSPALLLLPSDSALEHNTDYSLFQQTEMDFAPLRAYPDVSEISDKCQIPPLLFTSGTLDQPSLSQHPLEETGSSCCSHSQSTLSPTGVKTNNGASASSLAPITDNIGSKVDVIHNEDTYFLNKNVPAEQLMDFLQKDVGVLSSSSSDNSLNPSEIKEYNSPDNLNPDLCLVREGPPGEGYQLQPQTNKKVYVNDSNESKTHLSDGNVTVGSRSTKPDENSEALRQQLLDSQRHCNFEATEGPQINKTPVEFAPSFSTKIPKLKTRLTKESASLSELFSAGIKKRIREQDLWSSGNQTGIDGSYLGFLPQSQSTPGVFTAPLQSDVKSKILQLTGIESTEENMLQSRAGVYSPSKATPHPEARSPCEKDPTCDKVQSLPSLTYMQKVDAWRANHSSGKASLFDSLALQGFTGVSPKKKAYDAISDSLNHILSQQVGKMSQNVSQNPSVNVSPSSSPRREEAVGSAPSDKDNMATTQPPSPFNRSQSHSSLSTVVMSVKKDSSAEAITNKHEPEETVAPLPSNKGNLSPLVISVGQFSDVTLSNSQNSSNSGLKVATSVGTSSVSLEVDNYDPYWTRKASTPPPQYKPRELNIEERIPLYLQNLGINQSPSTILTPFAPRGPIREPEFSPTELCTIKGSTPTRSVQLSENGTPYKAEFSRSSLQSVDSSFSVPLSAENPVFAQDTFRPASSSDSSAAAQFEPHPTEGIPSQRPNESVQRSVSLGPLIDNEDDKNLGSEGPSPDQNGGISFVSSGAFSDIHKLLTQADNLVSPMSTAVSDRFLSQKKAASFATAFSAEESKSQNSHLWTRSSSDSALLTREQITGGANVLSSRQGGVVSRSAGLSLILNKSVQRAEPEGCSAAPPDRVPQPQVQTPLPPVNVAEKNKETIQESPIQSGTSSPIPVDSISDGSSKSSLAIRVVKLLQTDSPATIISSVTSEDQEEGRVRVWLKQMLCGQKCEPLELDQEDRRRIEEIKRELLLENPKLGYISTETESSVASSLQYPRKLTPIIQPPNPSESNDTNIPLSCVPQHEDIEAKVKEVTAGEEASPPKTKALTSITISTCRRSTSSSPSTLPASPQSPTSSLQHLNQLKIVRDSPALVPPSSAKYEPGEHSVIDKNTMESPALNNKYVLASRQDTAGGQNDDALTSAISVRKDQDNSEQLNKAAKVIDQNTVESPALNNKYVLASRQDTAGGQNDDALTSAISVRKDQDNSEQLNKAAKADDKDLSETEQVTNTSGHVSQVRLTLSPKHTEHGANGSSVFTRDSCLPQRHFIPLRCSPSIPSSPDEGVGLSSPHEWHEVSKSHRRYDASKSVTRQKVMSSTHVSPKPFVVGTTTVPHLLPYKPRGSEELFYVPQTEADSSTDTTMESTHTGSDDALPPHFSSDVLGHQDAGLDRGVTTRHTEGIYSKRVTQPHSTMTEWKHRDAVNKPALQTPKSTLPGFTQMPFSTDLEAPIVSQRDQGTSPVPFFTNDAPAPDREILHTGHQDQSETKDSPSHAPQQDFSNLDQLWQKFSERWWESRPISEREASLLERLERLSRIIQSTQDSNMSDAKMPTQEPHKRERYEKMGNLKELKRQRHSDKLKQTSKDFDNFKPCAAQEQEDSFSSSSTSVSTVDTERLIRVFGADRVQKNLKSSSSLSRLYSAISKQKEQDEQGRSPSETKVTEEFSVEVDSVSSTCTYILPLPHGPSKSLISKRAVKLVSKGIQAGDLEIVNNGTRRHTRDVGTTFPSPSDRASRPSSFSSLDPESKAPRSPASKSRKHRKSSSSPTKLYPHGITWCISADELKAEARKENKPEEWRPSAVWFEPLARKPPWREPLRQRPLEEQNNAPQTAADSTTGKKKISSLSHVTLQDALQVRRPDFVSRSRQRLERLALQVEERHLQSLLHQENEELFNQPGPPGRLPRPAGAAYLRRAVPRKEMIQRSKQIYENLPEVRRRREEEQRKAEYRSYRLNAQLYNKRITNRVLGRRSAWS